MDMFPGLPNPMQQAQTAAPSVAQPGGGPQMVGGGLTPQQQELLANLTMLIAAGKQVCNQMAKFGLEQYANDCETYFNRLTKLKLKMQDEFQTAAEQAQLMNMAQGGGY